MLFEKIQLFADDVLMRVEPKEMMLLGIMSTPAVVIDGRVMCAGRVPSGQEAREWIAGAADHPAPRRDAIKSGRRILSV